MPSEIFTFPGRGTEPISPQDLRDKLTEALHWPRIDVRENGKRFEFWECGPVVFVETNGDGHAVTATVDFARVVEIQHVTATYKTFRAIGWTARDSQ